MIGTDAKLFGRLSTAMVTPFDEKLAIDFKAVDLIVEHLIKTGTKTIVVNGTTGESPTLDEDEKTELLKRVLAQTRKRAKVVMGTGSNSTAKTVKASQEAEQIGADGLLVVVPYYNKPNADGLLAHFKAVAQSTSLPVILYNIPGRTGVNLPVETTVELAQLCPNITALKDSTGATDQTAEIAGKAPSDFTIYSGDDHLLLPFLSVGASGVVSVASHIVGGPITEIIENYFKGKHDAARSGYYKYLPLFKGLFAAPNPTCIKYALSKQGLCKPYLRLPLVELPESSRTALDAILASVPLDKPETRIEALASQV